MTKPTLYWHIHHEILLEETTDIQERIDYIRANKPEKEIPLRLKLMTPVLHPEKLPARLLEAWDFFLWFVCLDVVYPILNVESLFYQNLVVDVPVECWFSCHFNLPQILF